MRRLSVLVTASSIAVFGLATPSGAEPRPLTANTISLDADHPDSFRNFAPERPETLARAAAINTEFGLHVSEIEPDLYFVTDQIYQSAFAVTPAGVVVFDAPLSFGDRLRQAIAQVAPGIPVTHLIMSHGHRDHNGAGAAFADIPGLEIIAAEENAATQRAHPLDGVPTATRTFDGALDLIIGGLAIELRTTQFHAEDADVMIYLPGKNFLMAIDTITPGEAPFMNFGATSNVTAYFAAFDTFLAYEFTHFLSGHVAVLGTRVDVVTARDYAHDVRATVLELMPGFDERMLQGLEATGFANPNLAYRHAMETIRNDCAAAIVDRWETRLSVVDLWADSHCETILLHAITH